MTYLLDRREFLLDGHFDWRVLLVDKAEYYVSLLVYVEARLSTLTLCFSISAAETSRWSHTSL